MIYSSQVVQQVRTTVTRPGFVLVLWLALAVISGVQRFARDGSNNYFIFKNVFFNTVHQHNLYAPYPDKHTDTNHYGPFFAVVIAPFAVMPDVVGICLWVAFNGMVLFYAIRQLPIKEFQAVAVLWLVTNELFTAYSGQQLNPIVAATIILAYTWMRQGRDFWAAFVIMAGAFIKLYSIVGLAFFFFSHRKRLLVASCVFWAAVCFAAPMTLASPGFVVQSYHDWYTSLKEKERINAAESYHQDISLMGMVRRVSGARELSSLYFLVPGALLFLIPYTRFGHYHDPTFQMLLLCSLLMFVCLFSSGSESATYIIAFAGVALWFMLHPPPVSRIVVVLLVFAFVLTSLSPTDVFPPQARHFIVRYSLKALPCAIAWFYLQVELWRYPGTSFKQNNLSV